MRLLSKIKNKKSRLIWEGVSDRKMVNDMMMKSAKIKSMP